MIIIRGSTCTMKKNYIPHAEPMDSLLWVSVMELAGRQHCDSSDELVFVLSSIAWNQLWQHCTSWPHWRFMLVTSWMLYINIGKFPWRKMIFFAMQIFQCFWYNIWLHFHSLLPNCCKMFFFLLAKMFWDHSVEIVC